MYYSELPTVLKTQNFRIDVINRCLLDTLNLSTLKFASPALIYNVKDASTVLSWTETDVTSTLSLTTCGTRTWTVTKTDGSAIDLIFTSGDFT